MDSKKRKTCLDFLLPYSHSTMSSFCGVLMKLKKTPRMNFIIDESEQLTESPPGLFVQKFVNL
jgi:ribosome-binding factor A